MSTPWTLKEAQAAVDAWISQWEEGYFSPLSNLARLTEEVGELAREINFAHGDKPRRNKERPQAIAEEMGDILFVLIALANTLEVDLDLALRQVLEKYNIRDSELYTRR